MRAPWIALFLALLFAIPTDAQATPRWASRFEKQCGSGWVCEGVPIRTAYSLMCEAIYLEYKKTSPWNLRADVRVVGPRVAPPSEWFKALADAMHEGAYAEVIEVAHRQFGDELDDWARIGYRRGYMVRATSRTVQPLNRTSEELAEQGIAYLVALAVLRTDGMVERAGNGMPPTPWVANIRNSTGAMPADDPAANIEWASRALRALTDYDWVDNVHLSELRAHEPHVGEPPQRPLTDYAEEPNRHKRSRLTAEQTRYKQYRRALHDGQYATVVHAAYDEFGYDVNGWALNPGAANWSQRGIAYVVALAVLRSEGQLSRNGITDAAANVKWATRTLESLAMTGRVREIHLAEAWGRDPATYDAALQVLEKHRNTSGLQQPAQILLLERLHRLARAS